MNHIKKSAGYPITNFPKTIILVVDINAPGGVSNYYRNLKLNDHKNISYFVVTKGMPQSIVSTVLRLIKNYAVFIYKVFKEKYEIVLINPSLDLGKSFYRDMVFIILSKLLKRKAIVFFRGWFDPFEEKIKRSKFKTFLFRISYAKADKYIVLGNIFKNKLIGLGVPSTTEFFIETTVAESSYLKEFNFKSKCLTFREEINFLFLSRIEKEKGIYIAIDAFAEFLSKHSKIKSSLIIAGDGPDLPAVKEYVENENIQSIKFLGNVSGKSKMKVLLESHIMIFPSYTEGLPNCILEGMLYGMPIISRATGGIPEIVHENLNGYLSESFNSSVFADFLFTLASNYELYEKIGTLNHSIALEKFTVENVRERIGNIIRNIEV
jgi:glycosyltransferase involved in cell wall biosynthesis